MTTLITGAAGFIGYHLCDRLLALGERVIGLDDLNDYYSSRLKRDRAEALRQRYGEAFTFIQVDFADEVALERALENCDFDIIAHLGGQPGVRYSIDNPRAYVRSNLLGHLNLLEVARHRKVQHMVYASSSSIYGARESLPFCVDDRADWPVSLYAATKRADELMSESYSHLFRIPLTGLRLFTVYGPWGRPDMALWLFTDAILEGRPISLFNHGMMLRDFTYIDDIVDGISRCLKHPPSDDHQIKAGGSKSPHRIYNIGNSQAEELSYLIDLIEEECGRPAERKLLPMQPGDLLETRADISAIAIDLGFKPKISLKEGVPRFVEWFRHYNGK